MAFDVLIDLSIGSDGTGLLVSDLNIDFTIERSILFYENTARFTVYNAKADTRAKISKEGNNVIFKFGHNNEELGVLFIGNVVEAKSYQADQDWVTEIVSASMRTSKNPLDNVTLSLSYAPGIVLSEPLKNIGAALGLVVLGSENANITLYNGWTYAGAARGALDYCKKILEVNGATLYVDNNEIVIYNVGSGDSRFTAVYLDYESGLIRVDEVVDRYDLLRREQRNKYKKKKRKKRKTEEEVLKDSKKIEFESIIIPKLQPNGLITIKDTGKHDGTYLIEKLKFEGNNYGGENVCYGEAIE